MEDEKEKEEERESRKEWRKTTRIGERKPMQRRKEKGEKEKKE